MKKLITVLLFAFLSSCNNEKIEVENPEKITTLEIKNIADRDSVIYKVVYLNDKLYLYNISTCKVEKELKNLTGFSNTLLIFLLFLMFLILAINFYYST